jgi:hypothetical protein
MRPSCGEARLRLTNPSKNGALRVLAGAGAAFALVSLAAVPTIEAQTRRRGARPPAVSFTAPLPEPRPAIEQPPAPPPAPPAASSEAPNAEMDEAKACLGRLSQLGVKFAPAPPPAADAQCRIDNPVRLEAIDAKGQMVRWPDRPLVSCGFAEILASFTRDAAQPLARGILGSSLAAFGTGNGFECRSRNRQTGGRISAHGQGLAVDISWFEISDGPRLSVATPGNEERVRFVDALRKAACGWFTTVLGPGSDSAHADHLHLDREPRGRDGQSRLCQ